MADCADLTFSIEVKYDSINFTWGGYDDSLQNYVSETMSKLAAMKDKNLSNEFNQVKEKLMNDWKNAYFQQTYQMMLEFREKAVYSNAFSKKEMRSVLEKYTYEQFMENLSKWMKNGRVLFYACGNFTEEEARAIGGKMWENLRMTPIA